MGFSGSGWSQQGNVVGLGQPAAGFRAGDPGDPGAVEAGCAVKSKSVIVLIAGNPA